MKTNQQLTLLSNQKLAPGVFSMELAYPAGHGPKPEELRPGQFVGVYSRDASRLLPRPISICDWHVQNAAAASTVLRLVYRVVGKGTEEFSHWQPGTTANVLGILGNGYDVSQLTGRRVLLIGGGIGAPPLLGLARTIHEADPGTKITAVLGYRTNDLFLREDFEQYGDVIIATDDGSAGVYGTVIDAAKQQANLVKTAFPWDVICSCGPLPMLRGVKQLAEEMRVPCYVSMEERMACGIGACLGCVTKTTHKDEHSQVNNARICTEGPVFNAEDVVI